MPNKERILHTNLFRIVILKKTKSGKPNQERSLPRLPHQKLRTMLKSPWVNYRESNKIKMAPKKFDRRMVNPNIAKRVRPLLKFLKVKMPLRQQARESQGSKTS